MIEVNSYTQSCSKLEQNEQEDTNELVGNHSSYVKSQASNLLANITHPDSNDTKKESTHQSSKEVNGIHLNNEDDEVISTKSSSTPSLNNDEKQKQDVKNKENEAVEEDIVNEEQINIDVVEDDSSNKETPVTISSLSVQNSVEDVVLYPDNSGVNTEEFIKTTLIQNPKDRLFMLTVEKQLIGFLNDEKNQSYRFDAMNPYHRMLVHRIGAYFGLRHNVDQTKQCVIVSKNEKSRVPNITFQSIIPSDSGTNEDHQGSNDGSSGDSGNKTAPSNKKQILKREINDQENYNKAKFNNKGATENLKPPKTFEEKSADYLRAKNRIFNHGNNNTTQSATTSNNNVNKKLNDGNISHSSSSSNIGSNINRSGENNKSQPIATAQQPITILNRQKGPNKNLSKTIANNNGPASVVKSHPNNINNYQNNTMINKPQMNTNTSNNPNIMMGAQQQQQHGKLFSTVPQVPQQSQLANAPPPAISHYPTIPVNQMHHANMALQQQQQAPQGTQTVLPSSSMMPPQAITHTQFIQYPTVYSPSNEHHMAAAPHPDFQYRFQAMNLGPNDSAANIQYYNHVQSQTPQMSYYYPQYMPVQSTQLPVNASNAPQLQPPPLYQNVTAPPVHTNNAATNNQNTNSNTVYVNKVPAGMTMNSVVNSQQQQQQQQMPVTYHITNQQVTNNQPAIQYYQNNTSHLTSNNNNSNKASNQQYCANKVTQNSSVPNMPVNSAPMHHQMQQQQMHLTNTQQYSLINTTSVNGMYPQVPQVAQQATNMYPTHAMHPAMQQQAMLQPQQQQQQLNNNYNQNNHQISKPNQHFNQNNKTVSNQNNSNTMQMQYQTNNYNNPKNQNIRQPMNSILPTQMTQMTMANKNIGMPPANQQYLYQNNSYYQNSYYAAQQQQIQNSQQQPYNSYNNRNNTNNKNHTNYNNNKSKTTSYQNKQPNRNKINSYYKQNNSTDRKSNGSQQSQSQNNAILEAYEFSSDLTLTSFEEYVNKFQSLCKISVNCMKKTTNEFMPINANEFVDAFKDRSDLTHLNNSNEFILLLNFTSCEMCSQFYDLFNLNQTNSREKNADIETIINENNLRSLFKVKYFDNQDAYNNNSNFYNNPNTNTDEMNLLSSSIAADDHAEDNIEEQKGEQEKDEKITTTTNTIEEEAAST